ncbi:hypothetical protein J421_0401 [Gemmatirosa kalamazoonensis]|uniref:Uncharacterized protein n=1 Tax=Gemmatirosa kalamazoonensis TaxID=861299 RepID=W0REY1_9BACT|nr:hypothetical protein [Gemmatirosa kalamazoonensis]AHG87938.1 hypothetical protein J421_0401 [Gemmatirosa kalamazoonensis]
MLSHTADYALRAILVLARASSEQRATALHADETIAQLLGAPGQPASAAA